MNNQIEKSQDFILSELETGDVACVGVITGGNATISRMAAMGFSPGATVNMVQNYKKRPVIVSVRDSRIALARSVADKVYLRRVEY
jgi:Fe2+ transport system protein FeoA